MKVFLVSFVLQRHVAPCSQSQTALSLSAVLELQLAFGPWERQLSKEYKISHAILEGRQWGILLEQLKDVVGDSQYALLFLQKP